MPHLYVSVRLNGMVADQRLVVVNEEVWVGSCARALVSFPGPALRVVPRGDALQVQGRWLRPGHPVTMRRDNLEVRLEAVPAAPASRWSDITLPDLRVMIASAAVILFGAWWEAVGSFLERHPGAVATLAGEPEEQVLPAALHAQPETTDAAASGPSPPEAGDAPRIDGLAADAHPPCYPCGEPSLEAMPPVGFVTLE